MDQYDDIAEEYYDSSRHPTCANFREISKNFLTENILYLIESAIIFDIGAGNSIVAEIKSEIKSISARVVISDKSRNMINNSRSLHAYIDAVCICDAQKDLSAMVDYFGKCDLAICNLGDPYNTKNFWLQLSRIVKDQGNVIFTTPSYEWSQSFRANHQNGNLVSAEFATKNGVKHVPSFIHSNKTQSKMMDRYGFQIQSIEKLALNRLSSNNISEKISSSIDKREGVVTAYIARRNY